MEKYNIGIYGCGFVGGSVAQGFALTHNVKIYDKNKPIDSFKETISKSDYIFIALPTPMNKNGSIDLSIIDKEIKRIAKFLNCKSDKIIIIKSTVIPGITRKYQEKYFDMNFIFNPEFLTERNARLDFINTARIILGGKSKTDPNLKKVENVYRARFPGTLIVKTNYETAEFTKYLCNNFFSQKVMYFNEQKLVTEKFNEYEDLITEGGGEIFWDDAVDMLLADGRIGNSHYQVPGHDGDYGFGGSCFPKDLNAYINWAKNIGAKIPILNRVWEYNKEVRKNHDWEEE